MELSEAEIQGLGVALNEADWLGISIDEVSGTAALGFRVLALPADAVDPTEPVVVTLILSGVTRVAASLRQGRWNDPDAAVEHVDLQTLPDVVASFGGLPVYGWEFVDPPEADWAHWRDRLSLDARFEAHDARHVFDLFQEGHPRHLDLRVWFDGLAIQDSSGCAVPIGDFIADGVRWWDAMYAGDPRTDGHGIYSAGPTGDRAPGADPM